MAESYKRLASGYKLIESQGSITGEEQFLRDDDYAGATAVANLPVIGTTPMVNSAGSNISSCLPRRKVTSYPDGDINHPVVTYEYSTTVGANPAQNIEDTTSRTVEVGTELVTKSSTGAGWRWKNQTGPPEDPATHPQLTEAVHSIIPVISVTVPVKKQGGTTVNTWMGTFVGLVGKINSAAFTQDVLSAFPVGSVLLTGLSGGTKVNEFGSQTWAFNVNFAVRIIPGLGTQSATNGNWNQVWNQSTATWDVPQDSAAGTGPARLYETGDIKTVLD